MKNEKEWRIYTEEKKKRIEMWIKCKNRKNKKREGGRKRKEE